MGAHQHALRVRRSALAPLPGNRSRRGRLGHRCQVRNNVDTRDRRVAPRCSNPKLNEDLFQGGEDVGLLFPVVRAEGALGPFDVGMVCSHGGGYQLTALYPHVIWVLSSL